MDLGLDGRVFVITGGTGGLGLAAAHCLVAEGASVVVSGRDGDRARAAAESLGTTHSLAVVADNADAAAPERLVAAAMARFGRLDGALMSVGGPPLGGLDRISDDQWRAAFESVFLGAVRVARAVVSELPADGGALLFVLSSSVREPIPALSVSNGLRPGLAMLAKEMAAELGPRGVRVNGLLPARIRTDRIRALDAGRSKADLARTHAAIPLRRDGRPEEFGRVAAFLLSPAASYLTGVMLPVDGGMLHAL